MRVNKTLEHPIKICGKWNRNVNKMETEQIRTRHGENGVEE